MFRVEIVTLDISLKGRVLCSLMAPFYVQPPVGMSIIVIKWVCGQLVNAALFALTHLNIRTHGATSCAGFTEEACCLNNVP